MSLFKTLGESEFVPSTPQELFANLTKGENIKFLWSHQDKLLSAFGSEWQNHHDLALELPTGSGKTLVGLLIGDFLRRTRGHQVAYLCPTRQLANQVWLQSKDYGIEPVLLVGKQSDYNPSDFTKYQLSRSIAITTYHGLFNVKPAISNPQVIICDDAHAADNAVASMWTMEINRSRHKELFYSIAGKLSDGLTDVMRFLLEPTTDSAQYPQQVELIPQPMYFDRLGELHDLLAEQCPLHDDLKFSWGALGDHLFATNVFVSPLSVLIRPLIPPTRTHGPFADSLKRIYMSATIGDSGDLEREFGVQRIKKLSAEGETIPASGRRFFLFTDLMKEGSGDSLLSEVVRTAPRTLVLTSDNRNSTEFATQYCTGVVQYTPLDIETSLAAFTGSTKPAVLLMANRYDGLDLRDEACRHLIFVGLPGAGNLQDRFLLQRFGATAVYNSRIRTAITQGVGRCTRDASDYAVVLAKGSDLLRWCSTTAHRSGLMPDLRAEIEFGIENSEGLDLDRAFQLIKAFLSRSPDWDRAEADIKKRRSKNQEPVEEYSSKLMAAAEHEVAFTYQLWAQDYENAFHSSKRVLDQISGDALKPYRALWHYLAASTSYAASIILDDEVWRKSFEDQIARALAVTQGISWLVKIRRMARMRVGAIETNDVVDSGPSAELVQEWRLTGPRFERETAKMHVLFEEPTDENMKMALETLGRALGAERVLLDGDGAPDGFWLFPDERGIVFEAKTEEDANKPIPLRDVRQALTHGEWVRSRYPQFKEVTIDHVVVTSQTKVRPDAKSVSGELYLCSVVEFAHLWKDVESILREVRDLALGGSAEELGRLLGERFLQKDLSAREVRERVCKVLVRNLDVADA